MTETSEAWAARIVRESCRFAMAEVERLTRDKLASSIKALTVTLGAVTWYGDLAEMARDLAADDQDPHVYGAGDRSTIARDFRLRVAVPVMIGARLPGDGRKLHRHIDSIALVDIEGSPPRVLVAVLLDKHTASLAGDVAELRGGRVRYRRVVLKRPSIGEMMAAGEAGDAPAPG